MCRGTESRIKQFEELKEKQQQSKFYKNSSKSILIKTIIRVIILILMFLSIKVRLELMIVEMWKAFGSTMFWDWVIIYFYVIVIIK